MVDAPRWRYPPTVVAQAAVDRYVDLGVDEVYLHHVGRDLRDCVHVFGPAGDRDALHAWAERAASDNPRLTAARPCFGCSKRGSQRRPR